MFHHYTTKYGDGNNNLVVESWLQFNFLKWRFTFSDKKIVFKDCYDKFIKDKNGMLNFNCIPRSAF
jgi:hypothetical protein